MIDVSAMIGAYPFREVPHPDAVHLRQVLEREGLDGAWVGHLPTAFHRDPAAGNAALYRELTGHEDRLRPAPAVRPDWPHWQREIALAVEAGAHAVRAWPQYWALPPGSRALHDLAMACAAHGLTVVLTVRLEDSRQRHHLDFGSDLPAATVRDLARNATGARIVVVAAGRSFIEEVHWGLTPAERERVWFDTSWIWGPPEDDFAHLLRTIGPGRLVYGTGWPMRLAQVTRAHLALLPPDLARTTLSNPVEW